ncbi:MAG: ABC transporter permease [Symploca sp. SIO1A3]|nr:ABC transporter permease [Symploca sp. SIO1A3]
MKNLNLITFWGVYTVWLRHARVYQKTWLINSLPPLSEPMVYLIAFGYGLTPLVGDVFYKEQTVPYLQFIAPGMIGVGVLFQSFFEGSFGSFIRLSFQKTWHALLTTPLTFTEVFIGDWLWATTKGMIAGTLTGLLAVFWGLYPISYIFLSLPLIFFGSILFAGAGLLTAGSVRTVDQINVPIFLWVIPMFTLGGTYFPRDGLPPLLNKVISILPFASFVDLLRWPLGLPNWWLLSLLWLLLWTTTFGVFAWRKIHPQLFH